MTWNRSRTGLAALVAALLATASTPTARAADEPLRLTWDLLLPTDATPPPEPQTLGTLDHTQIPEPSGDMTAMIQVVHAFDDKRVRIPGFVVPLDFQATEVTEFLLVPYFGACIHVPPPPPNQIVYVTVEEGFAVPEMYDPVYVTGIMSTQPTTTELADIAYWIKADRIEPYE
jgi:hypothetical protein